MKVMLVVLLTYFSLLISVALAAGDSSPAIPGADISGAYYDWTKTKLPEKPYYHKYDQTLTYKMLLAEKMNGGKDCKVDLTFAQTLDVIKRIDVITCGAPKIVYVAGWQYNGHDSKYPALGEVNEKLKRPEDKTALDSLKWLIAEGKKFHTTVSLHICMIEANEDSPLWKEYLEKDIIAKDKQGNPLKGEVYGSLAIYSLPLAERDALSPRAVALGAQQSYNVSYARQWETGETQKLIDGLMAMLPELKEGHTIHIDAFHTYPPIPFAYPAGQYTNYDRNFNGISPYLGYTAKKEAAAQRKIFRYFRDKYQMDVTCEGSTFLRFDPFVGLQPMAYHYGGPTVPPKLYCGTPLEHAETNILNDPHKLGGLLDMFCTLGAPVIWSNHWRHDDDTNQPQAADWKKVQQGGDVCIPLIWKKEKTLIAYSRGGYANKTWELPADWKSVKTATLTRIASDGSKTEDAGTAEIKDGKLTLALKAGEALMITE